MKIRRSPGGRTPPAAIDHDVTARDPQDVLWTYPKVPPDVSAMVKT